jgi:hypothetical protein
MSEPATVEETRKRLDYEAQCYRQAEELVRNQLLLLQFSVNKSMKAIRSTGRGAS